MDNSGVVASVFPEIKDPEATAAKIQIALGPGMTFELGWLRAMWACRLHHEEKALIEGRIINWRLSGVRTLFYWGQFAVKFEKVIPIPQAEKPSTIIHKDLAEGF